MGEQHTNPEIELARELILETGCSLFLTGRAGTGKTTFLHTIRHNLEKRCVICAPTGVAAINCGGVTLHSFFQLPFGPILPGSSREQRFRFTKQKRDTIRNLDLLVIDEISMVRADLLDGVDGVLRKFRRNSAPFGGVQLLLIGDLYQLPPVVKDHERRLLAGHYNSTFFFGSHALQEMLLYTIELQHVYRQEDQTFIDILNQIREGRELKQSLEALNHRVAGSRQEKQTGETITLCSHNRPADHINDTRLEGLDSNVHRFKAEVEGEFPEQLFPAEEVLELKKGAQVMFLRNDQSPEKRYFNGKIGRVTALSQDEIRIRCNDNKEEIVVEPATWENSEYSLDPESLEIKETVIGSFHQFPLKLAWAITIHKSQGLTFDAAIIDATRAFAAGQVYVALSRCRSLEGLTLTEPVPPSAVRVDPAIHDFLQNGTYAPGEHELLEAKIRYQQQLLVDCFDFELLQRALNRFTGFLRNKSDLVSCGGFTDADSTRHQVEKEVTRVGGNFLLQLRDMFTPGQRITEDEPVRARLRKADEYFQTRLEKYFHPWLFTGELESDNKEFKKQGTKLLKELRRQVAIKQAGIKCFGNDFSPHNYFRALGRAELELTRKTKASTKLDATVPDDHPHQELLDHLKQWRTDKSKAENVAPFQILHYRTLGLIALHLPQSIAELKRVRGIGEKLAGRYGEELLEMVGNYRQQHELPKDQADKETKDTSS